MLYINILNLNLIDAVFQKLLSGHQFLYMYYVFTVFDLFNAPGGVTFSKRGAIITVNIYCIKRPFILIK